MRRLAVALALLASHCAPAGTDAPPAAPVASLSPAPAPAAPAVSPPGDVAELHRARCGKCHVRVEPAARTREAFTAALARHRSRVHLTEAQWSALLDYLAPQGA